MAETSEVFEILIKKVTEQEKKIAALDKEMDLVVIAIRLIKDRLTEQAKKQKEVAPSPWRQG